MNKIVGVGGWCWEIKLGQKLETTKVGALETSKKNLASMC